MLSTGLDQGLKGACLNQKRKITIPYDLGSMEVLPQGTFDLFISINLTSSLQNQSIK